MYNITKITRGNLAFFTFSNRLQNWRRKELHFLLHPIPATIQAHLINTLFLYPLSLINVLQVLPPCRKSWWKYWLTDKGRRGRAPTVTVLSDSRPNPRGLLPNPTKNNLATKPNIPSCLSKFHVRSHKLKERAHSRITTTQQHRTKLGFSIKLLRALIQGLLQLSDFTIVLILQNAMSFSTTN